MLVRTAHLSQNFSKPQGEQKTEAKTTTSYYIIPIEEKLSAHFEAWCFLSFQKPDWPQDLSFLSLLTRRVGSDEYPFSSNMLLFGLKVLTYIA